MLRQSNQQFCLTGSFNPFQDAQCGMSIDQCGMSTDQCGMSIAHATMTKMTTQYKLLYTNFEYQIFAVHFKRA